jgi:quercetin dioxygenase-like cupin family protein
MARMTPSPTFAEFEATERTRGCSEVLARSWQPNQVVGDHSHPFDARALLVQGEMWLTVDGKTQHLRVGDRFELAAGTPHSERYGAEGATYWVARTNA